jgi:glycosyltransferase involved in cell wall biosynthesis
MNRPRILFLTPKAPYPLTSGLAMRQYHLLRAYSTIAAVDLVFFAQRDSERADVAAGVGQYCERIHAIPFPPARKPGRFGPWPGWRRLTHPLLALALESPELRRLVRESAASTDLVHVSRLHLASAVEPLLDGRRRPRLVLDLDDDESLAQTRHLRFSPSRRRVYRAFHYADLLRLARYQRGAVRSFDRVFVCSEHDRVRIGRPNLVVVPNGIDVPPDLTTPAPDPRTLLFCGLLSYRPNEDAVQFFVDSIFPAIRREFPDARFVAIGRTPSSAVLALADGASVRIEPDVPSVADYYRRAAVAVVPLRMGGGTRIKILEAWSLGVPVVSTAVGCEGLDGADGEHLVVADTPEQFARSCVELLRSPARREALARAGRDLVSRRYRWETATRSAVLAVGELLGLPTPPRPDTRRPSPCLV